jgi:hypothetical protein
MNNQLIALEMDIRVNNQSAHPWILRKIKKEGNVVVKGITIQRPL